MVRTPRCEEGGIDPEDEVDVSVFYYIGAWCVFCVSVCTLNPYARGK